MEDQCETGQRGRWPPANAHVAAQLFLWDRCKEEQQTYPQPSPALSWDSAHCGVFWLMAGSPCFHMLQQSPKVLQIPMCNSYSSDTS